MEAQKKKNINVSIYLRYQIYVNFNFYQIYMKTLSLTLYFFQEFNNTKLTNLQKPLIIS